MKKMHPRISTALLSINPTTKRPAWHGCPTALGVLRGVGPVLSIWRGYAGGNNLREIALHIAFWENNVTNRITGSDARIKFEQRKAGWAIRHDALNEKQWKFEIGLVRIAHEKLVKAVANFDADKLDKPIGKRSTRKAIELIHGVAEHTLYHTAQMKMLLTLAKYNGLKKAYQ